MKGKRGFTLTELAIVLVVMGIVLAFLIPSLAGFSNDAAERKAVESVKVAVSEYKAQVATGYEKNVVVLYYDKDNSDIKVFGYDCNKDILYVFSNADWLGIAAGNASVQGFKKVARDIVKSADTECLTLGETAVYPQAENLFKLTHPSTGDVAWLNDKLTKRQQKKYDGNMYLVAATIAGTMGKDNEYKYSKDGVDYYVQYAETETVEAQVTATYKTTFINADNTTLHTFSTANTTLGGKFTCPEDPTYESKYFVYWELIKVNDENQSIPATSLVPGDSYDIPNSNVIYKAVYSNTDEPGLKNGTYQIYNAAQLNTFRKNINNGAIPADSNAVLMRSFRVNFDIIDSNGKLIDGDHTQNYSIGTSTNPYKGTFNGNGKSISGFYIIPATATGHKAMFAYTQGATIKNLTIKDSYFKGSNHVAAIVADTTSAEGSSEITSIINCNVINSRVICTNANTTDEIPDVYKELTATDPTTGEVISTTPEGSTYAGGIVAFASNARIEKCTVDGTVWGGDNGSAIGGIAGYTSDFVAIKDCSVTAAVSGVRYVGGIIGKANGTYTSSYSTTVDNCYNNGTVKRVSDILALPTDETDPYYITEEDYCIGFGGIVGGTVGRVKIINSFNEKNGKISAGDTSKYATGIGGVIGLTNEKAEIKNCRNYGSVYGRNSAGGIVGEIRNKTCTISNCTNAGSVEAAVISSGGIVGRTRNGVTGTQTIEKCVTTKTSSVKSNKRVGGILGDNACAAHINSCTNNGSVEETALVATYNPGAGGIVGVTFGKVTAYYCINNGYIKSACQGAGGIIGRATSAKFGGIDYSADGTKIDKCANSGMVEMLAEPQDPEAAPTDPTLEPDTTKLHYYAGGILGYSTTVITIDYSYNTGYITGVNHVGGIAGEIFIAPTTPETPEEPETPTEPEIPATPEVPTEPTASSISNCYSVGVVEASETEDVSNGTAGAILGTNEFAIEATNNYYLQNTVLAAAPTCIVKNSADNTVVYAKEKTKAKFIADAKDNSGNLVADSLVNLLNTGLAEGLEVFYMPVTQPGSTESVKYVYNEKLLEKVEAINNNEALNNIALPEKLPLHIDRATYEAAVAAAEAE